jgi:murein DD-endopeptidase MepM/ murein hydrolase activator NlpD
MKRSNMEKNQSGHRYDLQGFAVLLVILVGGVGLLALNGPASTIIGTVNGDPNPQVIQITATSESSSLGAMLRGQVDNGATPTSNIPYPTILPPSPAFEADATSFWDATPTLIYAPTPTSGPTIGAPTAVANAPEGPVIRSNPNPRAGEFSPPPELAPLSLDPRDHFWFRRPVDSSANSQEIYWYVYGSDGPQNTWRVHHGIDLPNPEGKEVHAAADGIVIWAADQYLWRQDGWSDRAYTYGNVVVVEHFFGFQGQKLYTLYAHLSQILVQPGQTVKMGDTVGLSGRSGVVSGPHVHFEVRVGRNKYSDTRNPILWIVPYEGHGVIAGRILYPNGAPVQDVIVKLWRDGVLVDSTTTYVNPHWTRDMDRWNVNPDEVWRENFAIGDVPAGDYVMTVDVNGVRYRQAVAVRPATTSFVDFNQNQSQPTPAG